MQRFLLLLVVLVCLIGCDDRSTDPDNMLWSWVHVYENGTMIFDETLDVIDDGNSVTLPLSNGTEVLLKKYVNIQYADDRSQEDDNEISRDYIILAEKNDYITRHYQCSYQDTIIIDAVGDFSPVPSGIISGTFLDGDHYPNTNNSFFVLHDSTIVAGISTNVFGYFENDSLSFGNYRIVDEDFYPDSLGTNVNITKYYDDYIID
ncbi:MAG TPA: hypothetical protein PLD62_06805 [Candidatus Cloacimonadota bacterium]|nr:hypothetical protein [Candidatus Cloacimonadota bacterium]